MIKVKLNITSSVEYNTEVKDIDVNNSIDSSELTQSDNEKITNKLMEKEGLNLLYKLK